MFAVMGEFKGISPEVVEKERDRLLRRFGMDKEIDKDSTNSSSL